MDEPPSYPVPTHTIPEYVALEEISNVKHEYIDGIIRAMSGDTIEEYVALEAFSNIKHEYLDGHILAMSGGTLEHSRLAARLIIQLGAQLRGRICEVYTSDARVHVVAGRLIAYPDISICCGAPETGDADPLAMRNPTVLVEVLSPSTEKYDRTTKFERYKMIEALREYVLVAQVEPLVEVFRRLDDGSWTGPITVRRGEVTQLTSIGCTLDVDELYRNHRATPSR